MATANRIIISETKTCLQGMFKSTFLVSWIALSYFVLSVVVTSQYPDPEKSYDNIFVAYFMYFVPSSIFELLWTVVSAVFESLFYFGLSLFFLNLARKQHVRFTDIFAGFKKFWKILGMTLLATLLVIIGMVFFIIPGIVAYYAYAQSFFVLIDEPNIGAVEALKKSAGLMRGHKWKLFKLQLRFILPFILGILTLGIAFLWIIPRWWVAHAKFYEDIQHAQNVGTSAPAGSPATLS